MLQSLRAYFIPYVITIKCIKRMQEKVELPCMLQRSRLISTKILGDLSLATIKNCKKILRGGKRKASCCPGGHLPPHGYGPGQRKKKMKKWWNTLIMASSFGLLNVVCVVTMKT